MAAPSARFAGMVFLLGDEHSEELAQVVRDGGGTVAGSMDEGVTHVVSADGSASQGVEVVDAEWVRGGGGGGGKKRAAPASPERPSKACKTAAAGSAPARPFDGMVFVLGDRYSRRRDEVVQLVRDGGGTVAETTAQAFKVPVTHYVYDHQTEAGGVSRLAFAREMGVEVVDAEWVRGGGGDVKVQSVPATAASKHGGDSRNDLPGRWGLDNEGSEPEDFYLPANSGWDNPPKGSKATSDWFLEERDYCENKARALALYLAGETGKEEPSDWPKTKALCAKYHITPVRSHGYGNMHPDERDAVNWTEHDEDFDLEWQESVDRADRWFDFDVTDASGAVFPVRAAVWPGDNDTNKSEFGLMKRRDTGETLVSIDGHGGDGGSWVKVFPACDAFVPHVAGEDWFSEDDLMWTAWQLEEENQLARILSMSMRLVYTFPPTPPVALRVEFAAELLDVATRTRLPRDLLKLIAEYDPPETVPLV